MSVKARTEVRTRKVIVFEVDYDAVLDAYDCVTGTPYALGNMLLDEVNKMLVEAAKARKEEEDVPF